MMHGNPSFMEGRPRSVELQRDRGLAANIWGSVFSHMEVTGIG